MGNGIPARIIQIYCAPNGRDVELPLFNRCALQNARLLNPNFEHVLFDRASMEAFLLKEFPEFRQVMDSFRYPIQRFDFFRYLAVYRLGGFYFDLDLFLARPLDELLSHHCVFPFEEMTLNRFLRKNYGMDWEVANYGFAAEAGNPFLAAVIENCVKAQREPDWARPMMQAIPRWFRSDYYVLYTTGPGLVTRTLAERPELASGITVLFPPDVCDERSWHQFGDFGVHLQQAWWRKRGGYLRRRMGNLWETWARRQGMAESRLRGKVRSVPSSSTCVKPFSSSVLSPQR